jgi:peptidyl-tRNA hydrolase
MATASDTKANDTKKAEFPYKMWFVVNRDLKMGTGKTGAQISHATVQMMLNKTFVESEVFKAWFKNSQPKIVLSAKEVDLLDLLTKYPDITISVRDAGYTQVKADSLTVVAVFPMAIVNKPPELNDSTKFKLCS